jgi:hypothetical protein
MCQFFARGKQMLESGELTIQAAVGLAAHASAPSDSTEECVDVGRDPEGAYGNGHCFALYRLQPVQPGGLGDLGIPAAPKAKPGDLGIPAAPKAKPRAKPAPDDGLEVGILEGTGPMKTIEVTVDTPTFLVRTVCAGMGDAAAGPATDLREIALDRFLSALGVTVGAITQISDHIVSPRAPCPLVSC